MADKTTIIGEQTRINGSLEGDEDLTVKGRVEGNIRLTKTLHVESGGIIVANVDVKDCVIAGVVVGDVTASDSVHINDGGRMVGDIAAPRVIIVAGAAFRGRVDMGDLESERAARPRVERKAMPRVERPAAAAAGGKKEDGVGKPAVLHRPAPPPRPAAAAVAPRVATASAGKQPAPPTPLLPGGKKTLKKK